MSLGMSLGFPRSFSLTMGVSCLVIGSGMVFEDIFGCLWDVGDATAGFVFESFFVAHVLSDFCKLPCASLCGLWLCPPCPCGCLREGLQAWLFGDFGGLWGSLWTCLWDVLKLYLLLGIVFEACSLGNVFEGIVCLFFFGVVGMSLGAS